MLLRLDRHSGVPVYRQIQDQIRFLAASGVLASGEELPSTRALAAELGLNPMTVSKAYAWLEHEGVLERRPGLALVVRARGPDQRAAARRFELAAELRSAVFAAEKLGFTADEAVALYRELLEP
jgi:DNA-binding transcriptional regulator YhcF (GntR family)